MSARSFIRELNSVSSARSVLMSQYNSTRASADGTSMSSVCDQTSSLMQSDSESWESNTKAIEGDPTTVTTYETYTSSSESQYISSSKPLTCLMTPRHLKSSKSMVSTKEYLWKFNAAANKIFTAAILYSYRKQKEQIKKLTQENEVLRRKFWKYDQQAYVYQKLYDDEKERNFELQNKLRASQNKAAEVRAKHVTLTKSIETLKAANSLLENQLHSQEEQFEGLQVSFSEVQSTLFKSMARERELQRQLCDEQRRVRTLYINESELVLKLRELKKSADDKKQNMWEQIKAKQAVLARYKLEKETLTFTLSGLMVKKTEFDVMGTELQNSLNEISQIKENLLTLRQQLENSWTNRFKRFWRDSKLIRHRFAEILLVVGYCVVPNIHMARTSIYSKIPLSAVVG